MYIIELRQRAAKQENELKNKSVRQPEPQHRTASAAQRRSRGRFQRSQSYHVLPNIHAKMKKMGTQRRSCRRKGRVYGKKYPRDYNKS